MVTFHQLINLGFQPIHSGINSQYQAWSHTSQKFDIIHHAVSGTVINANNIGVFNIDPEDAIFRLQLLDIVRDFLLLLPTASVSNNQKQVFIQRLNSLNPRQVLQLNQLPSGSLNIQKGV